ncbi:hypothetical protein D3C80_1814130 [compost metagenome]
MRFDTVQGGNVHALVLMPERKFLLHPLFKTQFFHNIRGKAGSGIFTVISQGVNRDVLIFKFVLINFYFEGVITWHDVAAF